MKSNEKNTETPIKKYETANPKPDNSKPKPTKVESDSKLPNLTPSSQRNQDLDGPSPNAGESRNQGPSLGQEA